VRLRESSQSLQSADNQIGDGKGKGMGQATEEGKGKGNGKGKGTVKQTTGGVDISHAVALQLQKEMYEADSDMEG